MRLINPLRALVLILTFGIFLCTLPFHSFGANGTPQIGRLPMKMRINPTLLQAVNARINKVPYVLDTVNYGVPDYWATPEEFYMRGGDCEDYAIAKMAALHGYGLPLRSMKMILVTRPDGMEHAMLSVRLNKKIYLLDNLNDMLHSPEYLTGYSFHSYFDFADSHLK